MSRLVPPGATERYLDLDGGRVRVLTGGEAGHAPTLLLLHGGSVDNAAISWYRALPALSRNYRVVAPDLPGFGATSGVEPVGGPGAQADFVARVMDRLRLAEAVVVGVSMGGDVALNLALRHPRRVRALVLVAPGGLIPAIANPMAHTASWLSMQLPDRLLLPAFRTANRFFLRAALRAVVHDPATLPEEVVAEIRREALRPGSGLGYLRYNQASIGRKRMRNNLLPLVDRITVPALFFHGASDPLVTPEGSRRAVELMPDARLVLVPECGHWAQLEASGRFDAEVAEFLAAADRKRQRAEE